MGSWHWSSTRHCATPSTASPPQPECGSSTYPSPRARRSWVAASAVLLDLEGARRCAKLPLSRRGRLFVIGRTEPSPDRMADHDRGWRATHPHPACGGGGSSWQLLSDAAEAAREVQRRGAVLAVVGARGGAGASVFATAIAHSATDPLLVDVDPWGGGLDLVLGSEDVPGLRWPELALQGGRVGWVALRAALPVHHGIAVLSAGRAGGQVDAAALDAVVDAGCRGGATVVCDLPRRATPAVETALASADLVVLVTPADVRSCASRRRHRPMARRRERERRTRRTRAGAGRTDSRRRVHRPSVFRALPPCALNRAWPMRWSIAG